MRVDKLETKGKWWFPERQKKEFYGELVFDKVEGGNLVLSDSLDKLFDFPRNNIDFLLVGELEEPICKTTKVSVIVSTISNIRETFQREGAYVKISLKLKYIFLGINIHDSSDLKFDEIVLSFSGLDHWISPLHDLIRVKEKDRYAYHSDPITIDEECRLTIGSSPVVHKVGRKQVTDNNIEILVQSFEDKSLDKYFLLERRIVDFLNFIISTEIVLQSFSGYHKEGNERRPIEVLFRSTIREKMNKVKVKSASLFDYGEVKDKLSVILTKWFMLYKTNNVIMDLYFGVMYNVESYLSNNFLMLFTALEVYHRAFLDRNMEIKSRRITKDRFREVYEQFYDILPYLSNKIGDKNSFMDKIISLRNALTHGNISYTELDNENLFWQYKNLQLILQLCILSVIGFNIEDIRKIYLLDKIAEMPK